ncbi:1-phosphatidylinositol 4,5-bisphosphate phosphodiesterase eta-2-like [Myxocyprinus asiaticus]|uniref:1-phosphatidylinositol 4,5-bisphosphate phosphodiesterase eta-2-like n=1 Tax=Myxocyprinus asiaticus TaxID=70543 RepID=UPI00222182E4|nr:1-phosphatidylinositol 4,5-bisphosphate phosphodiesterase eta-2-like [Myxocyprinus asiaticus]
MDTVSVNTSLFPGSQSISTDSPNMSMRSVGFTNDTDSFRSSTLLHWNFFLAANYISVVEKCMGSMQTGTQMVKLRGGSKGLVRFFYLDEHKSCIRWRPSRKNEKAKISIDSIREVCEGKQSEIFQRYADGSFDPNCCFSIYYGEHMESLDLVSGTGEEARTWITGLKYLMAGISDEDSLAKRQRTRDQWLKQTFVEADKNGDGCLSISEVLQLLHKLNVNLPRQKVKQMFKEADTDDNQGTLGFEEFCSFYKMMSTRRDLYLLMLTYSNHKDHLDTDDLIRFLETEQKMTNVTKEHCLEVVSKFEPCPENQTQGVLGIDGFTTYMRSPAGDIFNPEHYEVNQDMTQPLSSYYIASSHNTYLMGDQLMSQSRVDMYAWVLQAGCRCVEVDCWDGQDGEPIVHHGYTLTSKILFKDVIETINKYAFIKNQYPVILSIENHCSVPQQKKMAQYLTEVLGDKLDVSSIPTDESGLLPSPEALKGKILIKGKKLPPNIDENAEEGDVSDEDSADEMEDDCKLMNGDTSMNRKQAENVAKKKLDNLMKESKIRDREDPDSFTITALPSTGKPLDKSALKGKQEDGTDTGDEANIGGNKRLARSFMGSFSKRKKKTSKIRKSSSFEDTDTDQESSGGASKGPPHHSRKKRTMKLSRALSDLVYTKSVGMTDFEAQVGSCSWQVSSMSETKAHQLMQQKPVQFMRFNQRQLSRIYPSPYRVDSSNFNPQPFWNAGCHLVALNYQSEGRVLQLNRAKFYCNGNCGYIQKPLCMCEGSFNPVAEDPLPGRLKKQLILKIISGQQLPKPKDSMLGDRGEIIDPFVEVEIIGLPVDCCKEQTRVVDDNGFNPMWEETLVFTLHMPEIALVRFLVWDHDPIGQDFIGQRTIAFNSMIPGYRHVYLEGMEEASIFVHVAVNDITSKVRAVSGIKGLFHRNPKQASLDSHAAALLSRKPTFGAHLLRRTASVPTKGQPKVKRDFPEISIDTKDCSSEGASEEHESEAGPLVHHNGDTASAKFWGHGTNGQLHPDDSKEHSEVQSPIPSLNASCLESINEEIPENNPLTSTHSPVDTSSHCPSHSTMLSSPSTAITTSSNVSSLKNNEAILKPSALAQCVSPYSSGGKDLGNSHINSSLSMNYLDIGCDTPPPPDRADAEIVINTTIEPNIAEINSRKILKIDTVKETAIVQSSQRVEVLKAVFDRDIGQSSSQGLRTPVRRTKSEGQMKVVNKVDNPSAVPEVSIDATLNDRLWSKLDPSSHRDSVSSSSSISSNDTVIDLSLPNLSRKSLTFLSATRDYSDNQVPMANRSSQPRSTVVPRNVPRVSKSKSNPNLRDGEMCEPEDELHPRPLVTEKDANRLMQRRHTWSRLYMEGLMQSSTLASAGSKRSTTPLAKDIDSSSKSKSLGDLTSDDIVSNFESKYRSISRSFIVRPSRQRGQLQKKPQNDLTEQLKKLTDVEPLTSKDFAQCRSEAEVGQDEEKTPPLRRSSSRSQSRVRYIANRARQAQERQRLQSLITTGSPIEERGNPEGACSVPHSPCSSLDLLSQLPPGPPQQSPLSPDNEVFFMLKL